MFVIALAAFTSKYRIDFLSSESLPYRMALTDIHQRSFQVGELVKFKVPDDNKWAAGRKLTKIVRGLPGDVVSVKDRNIYINDELVGRAKELTYFGEPLFPIEPTTIPDGYFFAFGTHPDSYDSRYFSMGLINETNILGGSIPLF
nr:signal peptidase I [Enterovibrio paralichthyis]